MENMVMPNLLDIYKNKKILITGHTGFKGSWLSLWLNKLGADVYGISVEPETNPNHWDILSLDIESHYVDIRDLELLNTHIKKNQPDLIFHLAAQSLVRRSYQDPLYTWTTNIIGTANLLQACIGLDNLQSIVVVTTDKCYENNDNITSFNENDKLGGHDPYSASKACCELVAQSYKKSFFSDIDSPLIATARAGNVIGGGDWSIDRLIPDAVKAIHNNEKLIIRSPNSVRPWQHVLESLYGYLLLGKKLLERKHEYSGAWNFGPDKNQAMPVKKLLDTFKIHWSQLNWEITEIKQPHESKYLMLDNAKSKDKLGWNPVLDFDETIKWTAEWYRQFYEESYLLSEKQIENFCEKIFI